MTDMKKFTAKSLNKWHRSYKSASNTKRPSKKDGRSVKSEAHKKAISEGMKKYHAAKRKASKGGKGKSFTTPSGKTAKPSVPKGANPNNYAKVKVGNNIGHVYVGKVTPLKASIKIRKSTAKKPTAKATTTRN